MPVTEATYREAALQRPEVVWELRRGEIVERPAMSHMHGDLSFGMGVALHGQLSTRDYRIRLGHARLRVDAEHYFVPDVAVVPIQLTKPFLERQDVLEEYSDPLPLVVEIWSPSTGDFDRLVKVPGYQGRGDQEIWLVHPYDRWLRSWSRRAHGGYAAHLHSKGRVFCPSLPGVTLDLDALFSDLLM